MASIVLLASGQVAACLFFSPLSFLQNNPYRLFIEWLHPAAVPDSIS